MGYIAVIFTFSSNFPGLIEKCQVLLADTAGKELEY